MVDFNKKRFMVKICRLYYIGNYKQQEIAKKLHVSRTTVSRFLIKARKEGIVEININQTLEDFSEMEYQIEKKFGLNECMIVDTLENDKEIIRSMGGRINSLLERILDNESYIGIGWGYSLRELSEYINIDDKKDLKVVPIIGGLGKTGTGIHTNSVAAKIADKVRGISYMIHSPAIMDSKEVKEFMEKDSNAKTIIDLFKKVDTAFVGVSDLGNESSLIKTGSINKEDIEYIKSIGVIGDVNLIFINKDGEHVPNKIDERILRIPIERIKNIKNVITIALGKRKFEVLRAALKGKIINILLTDKETAEYILNAK